jgi:hypothetical protein
MVLHVALVSETPLIPLGQLTMVAAALQKQVLRDFGPFWDIIATVDAFEVVDQVPVDYWPILVQTDIGTDNEGYHRLGDTGQPFSVVRASADWTINVSHECLEMLADPYGHRLVAGESPQEGQGRVAFLVEVCDPCQHPRYAYRVNDVAVSDFCTPSYFDPLQAPSGRYSFSGELTGPHDVAEDGYLTWLDPATRELWQLRRPGGTTVIESLGRAPPQLASLREHSDRCSAELRAAVFSGPLGARRAGPLQATSPEGVGADRGPSTLSGDQRAERLAAASASLREAVDALAGRAGTAAPALDKPLRSEGGKRSAGRSTNRRK